MKKISFALIGKSFSFSPKKPFQILAERRASRREASFVHLRNPELRRVQDSNLQVPKDTGFQDQPNTIIATLQILTAVYIKNSSNGILSSPACGGLGSGGQKIWIVPSRKLTISSFSLADKFKNSRSEYKII